MNTKEERIRTRAYELWEKAGRTGEPEDHWLQAERELADRSDDPATVNEAQPATEAAEAAGGAPTSDDGEQNGSAKRPQNRRAS